MKVMFVYFNKDYRPRTLLSLSILDTILKKNGHETKIFDTSFYLDFANEHRANLIKAGVYKDLGKLIIKPKTTSIVDDFIKEVVSFQPELIGFSYYSINEDIQQALFMELKSRFPYIKVIAGGPTACASASKCFDQKYIDMVCCGEGEDLIKIVCDKMSKGESLSDIKGLWLHGESSAGVTNLVNINSIPTVNYESYDPIQIYGLFDGSAYRMGHVEFTRGCPYNCSYCGSGSIRKMYADAGQLKYVRHKDPKIAVKEYKELKEKYDLEMFYFIDGTFTAMPTRVLEELTPLYKKEVGLPFIALVHPNTIKKDTPRLLKTMGCIHVTIGIESGDEEYRDSVLGRKMSDDQIIKSVRRLQDAGIRVSAYNMIGLPGMNREHVFKTIHLNKKAKAHTSIVGIFMPFPDNELTQSLIQQGMLDPNNIVLKNGLTPSIEIEDMSRKEIVGLFNTFNLYVSLPKAVYPLIRILEKENWFTIPVRRLIYKIIK